MSVLDKEYYSLQDIVDEINLANNYLKEITIDDILEQGAQGKITINLDINYKSIRQAAYLLSKEECRLMFCNNLRELAIAWSNYEFCIPVAIKQLYVLRREKERFVQKIVKAIKKKSNSDKVSDKHTSGYLNRIHKNFAPELKIAIVKIHKFHMRMTYFSEVIQ